VSGGPGEGLTVRVRNPVPAEVEPVAREFEIDPGISGSAVPGAGQGLIGLAERARLIGGRLEHGRSGAEFRLLAWLPWAARPRLPEAVAPAVGPGS
jgi:hypothetical protein